MSQPLPQSAPLTLVDLPASLLYIIINDWVYYWHDILALDTAVTQRALRPALLTALTFISPLNNEPLPYSTSSLEYLQHRNIAVTAIQFKGSPMQRNLPQSLKNSIKRVLLIPSLEDTMSLQDLMEIITQCTVIQEIDFRGELPGRCAWQLLDLSALQGLQTVSITFSSLSKENSHFDSHFFDFTPSLKRLHLNISSFVRLHLTESIRTHLEELHLTCTTFSLHSTTMINHPPDHQHWSFPRLTKLCLENCHLPKKDTYHFLLNCPNLTTISINIFSVRNRWSTDLECLDLARTHPKLESITFTTYHFNPWILTEFVSFLPRLHTLHIYKVFAPCCRELLPDAHWHALTTSCPRLTSLNVADLVTMNNDSLKGLCQGLPPLRYLSLKGSSALTDQGLEHLHRLFSTLNDSTDGAPLSRKVVISDCPLISLAAVQRLKTSLRPSTAGTVVTVVTDL